MSLILHAGAQPISIGDLRLVETPEATRSHVPVAHARFVDLVRHALSYFGHEVTEEQHGITPDGMRYFGVMKLKSLYGDYEDVVGLRNSNDKKFPLGLAFGSSTFVCDNLSFVADHVMTRKHTANAQRDLPWMVEQMVAPLADVRISQARKLVLYKETPINTAQADHAIMQMYRDGVINVTRIPDVLHEWNEPTFEEFSERNAWRLFNAVTFILTGSIVGNPRTTTALHNIIDGICQRV